MGFTVVWFGFCRAFAGNYKIFRTAKVGLSDRRCELRSLAVAHPILLSSLEGHPKPSFLIGGLRV